LLGFALVEPSKKKAVQKMQEDMNFFRKQKKCGNEKSKENSLSLFFKNQ
jgi:hypothetical protein